MGLPQSIREEEMQTASQVPQVPQIPQAPQTPQISQIPVQKKATNSLIKTSFIIGLILLILEIASSLITPYLPAILINKAGWSSSQYGIFSIIYQSILFILPGIVGLILGIVGFRKMAKNPPPYDYFTAVAGIALCFGQALGLVQILMTILSSLVIAPLIY
jgi:hypothetical protein